MIILVLVGLCFLIAISPLFRCLILNIHRYLYNRLLDIYRYIRYKKYNNARQVNMVTYVANPKSKQVFGSGKTLQMCKMFYQYYKKYNNKVIYVKNEDGKYIKKIQRIVAFSNLDIKGMVTIPFTSLEMIEEWKDKKAELEKNDPDSIYKLIILTDELGAILNSRSFKSNITNSNINAILQQRHLDVCMWLSSSQRFNYIDALYRNSIDKVTTCKLVGLLDFKKRLLMTETYLAQDIENIALTSENKIKPLERECYFISDEDYDRYDTKHMIEDLIHKQKTGDLITDKEYLESIQLDNNITNINIKNKKKKGILRKN